MITIRPHNQAMLRRLLLMTLVIGSGLVLLELRGPAHSQEQKEKAQKPADETAVRIETELVQIDIVVADKQGKLVRDLRREDFELYEDGKKQEITHFAQGSAARPARWLTAERPRVGAERSAPPSALSTGRYIVLAVDDFHLAAENLVYTRRALLRFVNEQMAPGDQVALVTTSGSIGMFQQFTNERDVLERAINRLTVQNRTVTSISDMPRITDYQAELIDMGDQDAIELAVQEIMRLDPAPQGGGQGGGRGGASGPAGRNAPGPDGGISARERATLQVQTKARMIIAQNVNYSRATLSTLESVIRSLNGLPGRKMMLLLTDGFYMGGRTFQQAYDIRRITDAATRSGVVIYSIDARGLIAAVPGGDASDPGFPEPNLAGARARIEMSAIEARRDAMNALAADTGGKAFYNSNDLSLGLQRALDDNETYYVLAYEPAVSRRDGRFHQIEVRVADRPELKVRTRKGYLARNDTAEKAVEKAADKAAAKQKEKTPEKIAIEAQAAREKDLRKGLGSLFPIRDIPVDLAADFINVADGGSCAVINAHIDASQLTYQEVQGLHLDVLDLTVMVFDERGKLANSYNDRIGLNLKPTSYETAIKMGFQYRKLLPLPPGFYQARVAVREEKTGRLGSAAKWVEVPDLGKKQLLVSSILLSASENAANTPASTAPGEKGYQMRATSVTRRFKRGTSLDFLVFTYNASAGKGLPDLVIQSQVYAGSKLVYASPLAKMTVSTDSDLQRIPYAARISLEEFTVGDYELKLVVIDRSTKATTSRRINFSVE
ncbi:MAG: VWA domain-containing protein [Blastocatellia bacterium]|nr:VWA domain-containing protein [Blastocatellia bacterium]